MESALPILAITFILAAVTKLLQRKLVDRKKLAELQRQVKEDQKRMKELKKEGEKNKKEIEELQMGMLKRSTEMMNSNMKFSMVTLPIFLAALWGLSALFQGRLLESVVPLPMFSSFNIWNPASWLPTGQFSILTGYYKAYFFYYLIAAIIFNVVERIYDKVKDRTKKPNDVGEAEKSKAVNTIIRM